MPETPSSPDSVNPPKSRNDPCPCGSGKRYKTCHGLVIAPLSDVSSDDNVRSLMMRALAYQQKNDLQQAAVLYDQALHVNPHQADALHMRGVVALALGQTSEARQFILRAQSSGLDSESLRHNLSLVSDTLKAELAAKAFAHAVALEANVSPGAGDALIEPADVRLLAFYLPQFHTIPENDQWWGKGFTEWTNVRRGQPNFSGHQQPRVPGELGYYSLLDPEIRERQAKLARDHGVSGFCYYHYWFKGQRLLETPLNEVLKSGKPDFPFCVFWANESWSRRWDGGNNEPLMTQTHDAEDDVAFIEHLLPIFADRRYLRVYGRPLLMLYRIDLFPDPAATLQRFADVCRAHGEAPPFVLHANTTASLTPDNYGDEGVFDFPPHRLSLLALQQQPEPSGLSSEHCGILLDYERVAGTLASKATAKLRHYSTVVPDWDNTARKQFDGTTFVGATPKRYEAWLRDRLYDAKAHQPEGARLVFVNAWNEWAEGAYLEPDAAYGRAYLEATLAARRIPKAYRPIAEILVEFSREADGTNDVSTQT